MTVELAIPFHLSSTGSLASISDSDAQVRQHVFALVNTVPTERVTVPGYGVNLQALLFENLEPDEAGIQSQTLISTAMRTWEPGVELTSTEAHGEDDNVAVVDVRYRRKDAADSGTAANANTVLISAGGVVREIVRG